MKYADLPSGDARGFFGDDDTNGSLNRQTPQVVRQAIESVRSGRVFSLNAPLDWPDPPLYSRSPLRHTTVTTPLGNLDDYLDGFYPQSSSQWDGFLHIRDPEIGFYNHQPRERLGVHTWAARGIVGRGILFDMPRWFAAQGRDLPWDERVQIQVEDLEACRVAAGLEPREGDVLLIRTGWTSGWQSADAARREELRASPTSPGLADGESMLEYVWDWGVSGLASDNPSLEAWPLGPGFLHPHLLGRLGIPIGELWWLDELAEHCAETGQYDVLLTSAPLNLRGGVGSPANALAIA
ncbi:MAG: cyclase family protein [Aeromicrobium erythreum]